MVGVHPQLAAGALADRRGLAPVIGVGVGADQQPDVLEAEVDLLHRSLELGHRAGLVHARCRSGRSRTGGDRPRVAVGNPGPGQRQAQPPQPGQHPLPASELSWARHRPDLIGRGARLRRIGAARVRRLRDRWRRRLARQALLRPRWLRTTSTRRVACWQPGAVDRFVGAQELVAPDGVRTYFADAVRGLPGLLVRDPRPDDLADPHSRALAGPGDLRRPGHSWALSPTAPDRRSRAATW